MIELDDHERTYLSLKCSDYTDDKIASVMGRSPLAVRHMARRIRAKFNAKTILACAIRAREMGLIVVSGEPR